MEKLYLCPTHPFIKRTYEKIKCTIQIMVCFMKEWDVQSRFLTGCLHARSDAWCNGGWCRRNRVYLVLHVVELHSTVLTGPAFDPCLKFSDLPKLFVNLTVFFVFIFSLQLLVHALFFLLCQINIPDNAFLKSLIFRVLYLLITRRGVQWYEY